MSEIKEPNTTQIAALLLHWLTSQISADSLAWLCAEQKKILMASENKAFYFAFSAASRHFDENSLSLSASDIQTARTILTDWYPEQWTLVEAARIFLILTLAQTPLFMSAIHAVFRAADTAELVALYKSLPVLPQPKQFCAQAAEGIRSNMSSVFNAVALYNPYPANYLGIEAWNQMILKAVFIGSPLSQVIGLQSRANEHLAQMLQNFVAERTAAKRDIPADIWQLITPAN